MDDYYIEYFKYWLVNFVSFATVSIPPALALAMAAVERARGHPRASSRWGIVAMVMGLVQFAALFEIFRDGMPLADGELVYILVPIYTLAAGALTYYFVRRWQRGRSAASPMRLAPLLAALAVLALNVAGTAKLSARETPLLIAERSTNAEVLVELLECDGLFDGRQMQAAEALARNAHTPPKVLDALSRHSELRIREAVAHNPGVSAATLERLSSDDCPEVRGAVKYRDSPHVPIVTRTTQCRPTN
jgi:hypothetical protein